MTKARLFNVQLAGAVIALLTLSASSVLANEYFIDYANGSDTASGTSPGQPWKHAPGDAEALAGPAKVKLLPGDIVRFKGGVSYRGVIRINAAGAEGRPLTYTGEGYGEGRGIIDGADPVLSVEPCASAEACGNAANWQGLSLVKFTPPPTHFIKLYDPLGPLYESQEPKVADPFYSDEIEHYGVAPANARTTIEQGRLHAPNLARLLDGHPAGFLSFWIYGNGVARRPVTGIEGGDLLYDATGLKLQDGNPPHYALLGAAAAISSPGEYAVIAPGVAVVWMRNVKTGMTIGNGRGGINIGGKSYVTIRGFLFTRQTAEEKVYHQGMAIEANAVPATDLVITENQFKDAAMWNGEGSITLRNFSNVTISKNLFEGIERGSGLRASDHLSHVAVTGNTFRRLGRTGVAMLGVADGEISDNVMDDMHGIHGNGISLYLTNRRISVTNNLIVNTTRPFTFHGDDPNKPAPPGDHDFVIERNVFLASKDGRAAITSWGYNTRGVTIRNNIAVGPDAGFEFKGSDANLTAVDNVISGMTKTGDGGSNWQVRDNKSVDPRYNVPNTPQAHATACTQAKVPAGSSLGGWSC